MFEANESNAEKVEAVLSLFRERDRGDIVTHEEISEAIGLSPSDDKASEYYRIVRRARIRHRDEDARQTDVDVRVGFRILTVNQTLVEFQQKHQRKAFRSIGRGAKAVKVLPVDGLSMHQRRLYEAAIAKAAEQRRVLSSREAMEKVFSQPFPSLPFRTATQPAAAD